ncbi:sensor histidine kinase [Cryobacterium melibiosiphilum]|uniref:histidine kinase n=1 Tax=Cryobacterium melibiosiphilum TaxID=995039 RepID=A0A3A5MKG2_9MICO|nr:HAMP domain-containing sensor histidine kinase [Cryobacterium melibiosiphilum]RJT90597.1 sensor histidine kinase [Cryobacterium melibiosiphilum]
MTGLTGLTGSLARMPMRTTSLRLRVIAAVLTALTLVLVSVGILINVVLGEQLRADLEQRLLDRAGYAQILAEEGLAAQALANQLTGEDVRVSYEVDGDTVYGRQEPGQGGGPAGAPGDGDAPGQPGQAPDPAPGTVVTQSGDRVSVTQTIDGGTLTLSSSEAGIDQTLAQLRTIELIAGAITLVVTGALLTGIVGVALRPLTRMTEVFVAITSGNRGGRLRPSNPRTEIGRTAVAIDDMLNALETAENTARTAEAAARASELTARTAEATAVAAEDRMRQLLADVSHELRTPVAGLQASAETVLRDNPARLAREQLLVGMIHETHRAGRLVADLLLMTRLDQAQAGAAGDGAHLGAHPDSGQRMFHPVNLTQLSTRIVAEQLLLAQGRTLDLVAAGDDVWVHGDAERLTQVVTNLLDNARHATEPGGSIRLELGRTADEVRLSVTDSGAGVPPADRERIFERFVRLDESRASNRGGSGLGLPIARALARAHGGTLACVGTAGGARFELTLPRVPALP